MSNIIKIKRGEGIPANGVLKAGELGFDTTNKDLYIGTDDTDNSVAEKIGLSSDLFPLAIDKGGTSATTKEDALTNLGVDFVYKGGLTANNDLNAVKTNGIYFYDTGDVPSNCPFQNAGIVEVLGEPNNTATRKIQRVSRYGSTEVAFRGLSTSGWSEWVYINMNANKIVPITSGGTGATTATNALNNLGLVPTMVLGTEYATGRTYEGKTIYRQAVNLGTLPNAGTITINMSISGATISRFLKFDVFAIGSNIYPFPFINTSGSIVGWYRSSGSRSVWIKSNTDLSGYTGLAVIEYIKA